MGNSLPALPRDGLQAPPPGLLEQWRICWVNAIKSRAIRLLHKSRQGELLLLRMYFLAEATTVNGIANDVSPLAMPEWLVAVNAQHLQEEGLHIKLFAEAIKARGGQLPKARKLDWLSRHKVRKWLAIAQHYRSRFAWDGLVPAYAIGLCAEQMAMRVLERHCRAIAPQHPLQALLSRVWADETQHVETCAEVLQKLVQPEESAALRTLLAEIRRVDRAWGFATAVGLYAMACLSLCQAVLCPPKRLGNNTA